MAGANGTLGEEDVDKASRLFFTEASAILFQFETPLETTEYLLNKLSTENNKCNDESRNITGKYVYRSKKLSQQLLSFF